MTLSATRMRPADVSYGDSLMWCRRSGMMCGMAPRIVSHDIFELRGDQR
jgi:hypothetical protein